VVFLAPLATGAITLSGPCPTAPSIRRNYSIWSWTQHNTDGSVDVAAAAVARRMARGWDEEKRERVLFQSPKARGGSNRFVTNPKSHEALKED